VACFKEDHRTKLIIASTKNKPTFVAKQAVRIHTNVARSSLCDFRYQIVLVLRLRVFVENLPLGHLSGMDDTSAGRFSTMDGWMTHRLLYATETTTHGTLRTNALQPKQQQLREIILTLAVAIFVAFACARHVRLEKGPGCSRLQTEKEW
jgi:hypothetical protein